MKQNKIYRQGDVLVIPVGKIPTGLRRTKAITLALGEVTGHHHSILDIENAEGYAPVEETETVGQLVTYLRVTAESVELTHQEHSTINIPKGDYEIVKQVEFTPEALRNVAD